MAATAKVAILDDKTFVASEVGGGRRDVFYWFGGDAGVYFPFFSILFCEDGTSGEKGVGGEDCAAEYGDARGDEAVVTDGDGVAVLSSLVDVDGVGEQLRLVTCDGDEVADGYGVGAVNVVVFCDG